MAKEMQTTAMPAANELGRVNMFDQQPENTPLGDSHDSVRGAIGEPTLTQTTEETQQTAMMTPSRLGRAAVRSI